MQAIHTIRSWAIAATTALTLFLLPLLAQAQIQFQVQNFLKFDSVEDILVAVLNIFIVIATPIIVFFIIYAGFLYVTARGNAEQTQQATRALTYAIIGGVLILGAVALAEIIDNLVDAFRAS